MSYPITYNPHGVSNLRFDPTTGISGTILKLAAGELADETFRIFEGQIFFDPHLEEVEPFVVPVAHEVPMEWTLFRTQAKETGKRTPESEKSQFRKKVEEIIGRDIESLSKKR